MRIILLILGILLTASVLGDVYRSVDENGNVVFSDKPTPDAVKIEIKEVQTIKPGPVPEYQYSSPKKEVESETTYKNLVISSPANDATLSANDGNVSVSVITEPVLKEGHKIILYLDGKQATEGTGTMTLANLDRGTHTLSAAVKTAEGKEIMKSGTISFHIQRHSLQHKPSTVGKPPP